MNEPNNLMASCYSNETVYSTSWPKTKPISVAEQLEKWNKVRQSLYSQNGWCSENVNQISKWDVGDGDRNGSVPPMNTMHKDSYESGTNIWNMNLTHPHNGSGGDQPYPPMQHDPFCIAPNQMVTAAGPSRIMSANTPPQPQLTHWENTGAIPKIYNNNYNHHLHPTNLNCLSVTAPPNFEFPLAGSCSSHQLQQIASPETQAQNASVFYDCDSTNMIKPQPTAAAIDADDEVDLALRLQFNTMNLEQNFRNSDMNSAQMNNAPNLNPISRSIRQMPNQYHHHQVDCLPNAFSLNH